MQAMKKIYLILIPLLFTGCLYPNKTGVSKWHYDACKEYYDVAGQYHYECDNLFDYSDMKKLNPWREETPPPYEPCEGIECY